MKELLVANRSVVSRDGAEDVGVVSVECGAVGVGDGVWEVGYVDCEQRGCKYGSLGYRVIEVEGV